jgi:hypothetical protein
MNETVKDETGKINLDAADLLLIRLKCATGSPRGEHRFLKFIETN